MGVWRGSGRLGLYGSVAGRNQFRFFLIVWGKFVFEVVTQGSEVKIAFMQSFILTEVSDCGLLIVVTSSTFLKKKTCLKKKAVSPRSLPAS